MNIQVDPTSSNLASAMLNSKIRPRAVVGYGVKIFHRSPPNYVTRSPGCIYRTMLQSRGRSLIETMNNRDQGMNTWMAENQLAKTQSFYQFFIDLLITEKYSGWSEQWKIQNLPFTYNDIFNHVQIQNKCTRTAFFPRNSIKEIF